MPNPLDKGNLSARRYRVLDPLPDVADVRGRLSKGLRAHAFLPIDPRSDVDRSVGWAAVGDGDDLDLTHDKLFVLAMGAGEQLRVALRIDTLKAPADEVRRGVAARVVEIEAAEGRKVPKRERRKIKEEVARLLRQRAFARRKVVPLVWSLDDGRLWFFSQTKGHNEAFVDLFMKSTGLRVEVEDVGTWARGVVPDRRELAKMEATPELWRGFPGVRPLTTGADAAEAG